MITIETMAINTLGPYIIGPLAVAIGGYIIACAVRLTEAGVKWINAHLSAKKAQALDAMLNTARAVFCTVVTAAENTAVEAAKKSGALSDPAVQKAIARDVLAAGTATLKASLPQLEKQLGDSAQTMFSALVEQENAKLSVPKATPAIQPAKT